MKEKNKFFENIKKIIMIFKGFVYCCIFIVGIIYICRHRLTLGEFTLNFDWLFTIYIGIWILLPFIKKVKIGDNEVETSSLVDSINEIRQDQVISKSTQKVILEIVQKSVDSDYSKLNTKETNTPSKVYNAYNYIILVEVALMQKYVELKSDRKISEIKPVNGYSIIQELYNENYINQKDKDFLIKMLSLMRSVKTKEDREFIVQNYKKVREIIEKIK